MASSPLIPSLAISEGIGGYTIQYTKRMGVTYLRQICCVNKKFHALFLSNGLYNCIFK
jgi:hypothetical protein